MTFGEPLHFRIFLSSPGDVAEERRIACKLIDEVARQPLLRGQVTFEVIAYDDPDAPAPMSAMETPQVSVNRYSRRPAECDLTIVILWSRLGTPLPADVKREDGTCYESGTVWELEDAQQAKREVWIYRRMEEPVIGIRDPHFDQKRAAFAAVEEFFQRFTKPDGSLANGFNRYATQADFAPLLKKHLEFFVRNRLDLARETGRSELSPQASDTVAALNWNWPKPWDFSGYIADKRHGFVGREWLFNDVHKWISDAEGSQALLICADFGVGKSAFMAELTSRANGGEYIFAHHYCHHDTTETLNPATFVRSVAGQLAGAMPEYRSAVEGDPEARRWLDDAQRDPASAFEQAVVAPLNTIRAPGLPVLLVVDALDEALEFDVTRAGSAAITIVRLLAGRVKRLPAWLKILATSRRRQEVLQPMQQSFRCETVNGEDIRNLHDIRNYVARRCASGALARALAAAGMRGSDVATILSDEQQSGGKFLYAVRVLNDIASGVLSLKRLRDLPPGMDGFYLDAFEHRFPRLEDYMPVRSLLVQRHVNYET